MLLNNGRYVRQDCLNLPQLTDSYYGGVLPCLPLYVYSAQNGMNKFYHWMEKYCPMEEVSYHPQDLFGVNVYMSRHK